MTNNQELSNMCLQSENNFNLDKNVDIETAQIIYISSLQNKKGKY